MATTTAEHTGPHDHAHDHSHDDHHEPGFFEKYFFSTDHKVIGIQYGLASLFFLSVGFFLMMIMRWSIAYPDQPMPGFLQWIINTFLGDSWLQQGKVTADLYNMFGAMHGTIMVFLGVVPLGFAAFGNYVTPLQIGAPDMAFPRLNMWSFWLFFIGGMMMMASFFLPTGAAQTGWTNYSPLATTTHYHVADVVMTGQTWWLLSMVFIISSSLLGSVNFITTIINLRAKGMTWMRLPYFTWAMFVTAFLLLLAFPPLEVGAIMQLSDRLLGSSFFLPTGLMEGGKHLDISGGGSPLLFQHLFWFLGHPEVYVLLLPAFACIAEIIPANTRRPLWGYKSMVYATLVLGFLSFLVWAHHMYMTGMNSMITSFFQTTTVLISIPSVILLTCLMISLWGGSIRFTVPMLFAVAFIPMFGIGGLTGLPLAFALLDLHLHDTYYVIGHFHYVVAPGILFGLFAGIYHWFPKFTGRSMNTFLGHLHFWPTLIAMNVIFAPMFIQGMGGFHRRSFNGGIAFENTANQVYFTADSWIAQTFHAGEAVTLADLNPLMTIGAFLMAMAQIPFLINLCHSIVAGRKVNSDNPWNATTLEWATPTPPPHGNFTFTPEVHRDPYEYSLPGMEDDFAPQHLTDAELKRATVSSDTKEEPSLSESKSH
jgi:cytochrome c oxidase subunit I